MFKHFVQIQRFVPLLCLMGQQKNFVSNSGLFWVNVQVNANRSNSLHLKYIETNNSYGCILINIWRLIAMIFGRPSYKVSQISIIEKTSPGFSFIFESFSINLALRENLIRLTITFLVTLLYYSFKLSSRFHAILERRCQHFYAYFYLPS